MSAIGDVIHTLPALVALRRYYPEAHISWLVEEASAEIIEGHEALNEVLVWRRREFELLLKSGRWLRALSLFQNMLQRVRSRRYDLVIDFQALLKSGLWVLLSKGLRKVGFGPGMDHAEGSYLFLSERVSAISMEVHALDRGLVLLEKIGIPRGEVEFKFPVGLQARKDVEVFLHDANVREETPLVVIHPAARWETKLWFNDRFAVLADQLRTMGCQVVFSGGPGDAGMISEIQAGMNQRSLRFDGKGGLKHLAALCAKAVVVVSTDTGPMHLAAAQGTPVVALFGPTAPNRTGPYGDQHTILRSKVPCSPCFKRNCETTAVERMGCMKRIEVDEVFSAAMRYVQSNQTTQARPLKAGDPD